MQQPLLKSTLWAMSGIMHHYSGTPPHRKVSERDSRPVEGWLIRTGAQYGPLISSVFTWYITLAEILTIHSSLFRRITSFPNASDYATLDVPFLISFTVFSLFFFLRVYSFRVLGDMFTIVVTIRPDHKLMTAGPYRFVRHPSYTAIIGMIVGNLMLHLSVTDSDAVKWAFWLWTLLVSAVASRLWSRSKQEDEVLRKRFGAEWEAYRERVPYRLVPGLL